MLLQRVKGGGGEGWVRVGITKATVCLFNVISWMSVHRTAGHPSGKTLLLAIPQNCRAGEHVVCSLAINMLARGTASSPPRNLNEQNTEHLINGKLIMQTSNAAAIAFDWLGQAFEIQLFF